MSIILYVQLSVHTFITFLNETISLFFSFRHFHPIFFVSLIVRNAIFNGFRDFFLFFDKMTAFYVMYVYCFFPLYRTPDNYFIQKKLLPYEFRKVTAFFITVVKKCKASALHSKNCNSNSCWCTTAARAVSYSKKNTTYILLFFFL